MSEKNNKTVSSILRFLPKGLRICAVILVCGLCFSATAGLLGELFHWQNVSAAEQSSRAEMAMMDRFDRNITNAVSAALDGVVVIEKVYWLSDDDLVAPAPNQENFGRTDDPSSLQWLLDDAKRLLGGQETLFSTDVECMEGSEIIYYLDDTIFAVVWKEVHNDTVYTITEVKIAHPSQFRRFLADGEYGSHHQYTTTEMSKSVNAVTAASGDFYMYRRVGTVVYNGVVERLDPNGSIDSCFVDDKGNLIFSPGGSFETVEEAQKFVDDNNIRFSMSFGPILIDGDDYFKESDWYYLGETKGEYPREAICQAGDLHYYVIASNCADRYWHFPTLGEFTQVLRSFDVTKAYALDGGQTATIAMNHEHVNPVQYGGQRLISDIIYFATAMPDGG